MRTNAIVQFAYLEANSVASEFRHCETSNPVLFSSATYKSYSDAEVGMRSAGIQASEPNSGLKLWSDFSQPKTTEAGEGVVLVQAILWTHTRVADKSQQPDKPFWMISLSSQKVLVMAESMEGASELHKVAMGWS